MALPSAGGIGTVSGVVGGYSGDDDLAAGAKLSYPYGVAIDTGAVIARTTRCSVTGDGGNDPLRSIQRASARAGSFRNIRLSAAESECACQDVRDG